MEGTKRDGAVNEYMKRKIMIRGIYEKLRSTQTTAVIYHKVMAMRQDGFQHIHSYEKNY